ncbi:MAG: response regulator [Bacteroidota bacterium]
MIQKFIIVDDESVNNLLCVIIIKDVFPAADIQTFTDPESALRYIQSAYAGKNGSDTVLLLDINMPTLTGWEFVDALEKFNAGIIKKLKVYMLSSSIDHRDKERAHNWKSILDFIEKPLTSENVKMVANGV